MTAPGGLGVEGAQIVAYDHRFTYGTATTDADGAFAMKLPAGEYRVRVLPPDDVNLTETWLPGLLDICPAERFEVGDALAPQASIELQPGGILEGVVVDDFGDPVADAELIGRTELDTALAVPRRTLSDADGQFRLQGLPIDAGSSTAFALELRAEGVPTQFLGQSYARDQALSWPITSGEVEAIGAHELLPGVVVSGAVDGPDGPIRLGQVSAYSPSELVTASIQDGQYVAMGLPPGDVLTWARVPGFATTYLPDSDRPGERVNVPDEGAMVTGLDLSLPLESRVSGRLVGDASLEGASVLLYNSDESVGVAGVCDEDGSFVVEALHPGRYTLGFYASDEGFLDARWTDEDGEVVWIDALEGDTDVGEIPLVEGASVTGTVTDPRSGAGVYGMTVYAFNPDEGTTAQATTLRDGRYTISALAAGRWELSAVFTSWCEQDPDFVPVYYPDLREPRFSPPVSLVAGQAFEWSPVAGPDFDHDGMDDLWEEAFGLDPTRDDSAEDADGDGYTNYDEYLLDTDPSVRVSRGCACSGVSQPSRWFWALTALSLLLPRRYSRGAYSPREDPSCD